jgi:proteasome lid subunit RPN8/RPN11
MRTDYIYNREKKKKEVPTIDYPIVTDENKGKLIISPEIEEQIDIFHAMAGNTEWSGILLYVIKEGDISNPESLIIEVKGMFPMDIGSPGYTEYDYNEKTLDMYDLYPNALEEEWRLGHIHTHHSMQAYFSGTDLQELRDNIDNHAYYLSLIVNFDKKYCAKLCIKGEREVKESSILKYTGLFSDKKSNRKSNSTKIEAIVYNANLEIEMPEKNEGISFIGEILKLKKENAKSTYSNYSGNSNRVFRSSPQGNGKQVSLWDDVVGDDSYGRDSDDSSICPGYISEKAMTTKFLMQLIQVDMDYNNIAGESFEVFLKKAQRKYEDMTEADQVVYKDYIQDNVNDIAFYLTGEDTSYATKLINSGADRISSYVSRGYGWGSSYEDNLADLVYSILQNELIN